MEGFTGTIIELLWDFLSYSSHVPKYRRVYIYIDILEVMKGFV